MTITGIVASLRITKDAREHLNNLLVKSVLGDAQKHGQVMIGTVVGAKKTSFNLGWGSEPSLRSWQ